MQKDENKRACPPAWSQNFLKWFCPPQLYEGIAGDLIEKFDAEASSIGLKAARRNFNWGVIRFLRPSIVLRNKISLNLTNTTMLRDHLKVAARNVWKNKTNSFVNILGLTLGIICALVITLVIRYELSFDTFHAAAERTYRIVRVSQVEGQVEYRTGVANPLPQTLREEIPSLEKVTAMSYHRNAQVDVIDADGNTLEKFQENEGCAYVDEAFFDTFDFQGTTFKWLTGNPKSALSSPYTVVLTRSIAEKYFQSINVVGRTLKLEKMLDLKVTGVVEDLPSNSDLPFKLLISYATLRQFYGENMDSNWFSVSDVNQCYIVLPPGVGVSETEQQIARVHAAYVPKELSETRSYLLQPLSEVHSDLRFGNYNLRVVTSETIWALGIIGCFLLIMVCINFINLSTARSITRSKEVGIRKVMGSTRRQLVGQSVTETALNIFIASTVAMIGGTFILGKAKSLIGFDLPTAPYADPFVWVCLIALAVATTFLAGLYPALVLSRYKPAQAIKNNLEVQSAGGFHLRRVLLVTQFTIMQVLIIATFIAVKQMYFIKNVNMGFDKEAIINVEIHETNTDKQAPVEDKLEVFRNDLLLFSSIEKVSFSSSLPSGLRRPRWFWDMQKRLK